MAELAPNLKIEFSKKITMHENIFRAKNDFFKILWHQIWSNLASYKYKWFTDESRNYLHHYITQSEWYFRQNEYLHNPLFVGST